VLTLRGHALRKNAGLAVVPDPLLACKISRAV
jgi:hypothetical protein